jgi:hypothetical protein
MGSARNFVARFSIWILLAAGIFLLVMAWYFLGQEQRQRRAVLKPLLATNASLAAVRATAGEFVIWRPGTPTWDNVLSQCERGSEWDRHIASKMKKAAAVGHSSTISMQTWIFFNKEDRLIDFELGTQ